MNARLSQPFFAELAHGGVELDEQVHELPHRLLHQLAALRELVRVPGHHLDDVEHVDDALRRDEDVVGLLTELLGRAETRTGRFAQPPDEREAAADGE